MITIKELNEIPVITQMLQTNEINREEIHSILEVLNERSIQLEEITSFNLSQIALLKNQFIRTLLQNNLINIDQIKDLTTMQVDVLQDPLIQDLIEMRLISFEQALRINENQKIGISMVNETILFQLLRRAINFEQILQLDDFQSTRLEVLNEPWIRFLLEQGRINFEQALRFDNGTLARLHMDQRMIIALLNGEVTVEQVLNSDIYFTDLHDILDMNEAMANGFGVAVNDYRYYRDNNIDFRGYNNINNDNAIDINHAQSVHTASVHQSASASAIKLANQYPYANIQDVDYLNHVISYMMEVITAIVREGESIDPDLENKIRAAENFTNRILATDYVDYTDRDSKITVKQLLVLIFLASQDLDNLYEGTTVKDAFMRLIQGLWEIQRGYNLNDYGVDNNPDTPDEPICIRGTFNKLIESLQGVHQGIEIININSGTVHGKFMAIVKDKVYAYLKEQRYGSEHNFIDLIQKIKSSEEGIMLIVPQIKNKIIDEFFQEFGDLYGAEKENHPDFKNMMENIIYIFDHDDLEKLISKISKGASSSSSLATSRKI